MTRDFAQGENMINDCAGLGISHIEFRHSVPPILRNWVNGQLLARAGVAYVGWRGPSDRLTVQYDANELAAADLLNSLEKQGLQVAALRVDLIDFAQ